MNNICSLLLTILIALMTNCGSKSGGANNDDAETCSNGNCLDVEPGKDGSDSTSKGGGDDSSKGGGDDSSKGGGGDSSKGGGDDSSKGGGGDSSKGGGGDSSKGGGDDSSGGSDDSSGGSDDSSGGSDDSSGGSDDSSGGSDDSSGGSDDSSGPPVIDGDWTDWGEPTKCLNGYQSQTRQCSNPPPSGGGKACSGKDVKISPCIWFRSFDSIAKSGDFFDFKIPNLNDGSWQEMKDFRDLPAAFFYGASILGDPNGPLISHNEDDYLPGELYSIWHSIANNSPSAIVWLKLESLPLVEQLSKNHLSASIERRVTENEGEPGLWFKTEAKCSLLDDQSKAFCGLMIDPLVFDLSKKQWAKLTLVIGEETIYTSPFTDTDKLFEPCCNLL